MELNRVVDEREWALDQRGHELEEHAQQVEELETHSAQLGVCL